MMCVYVQYTLRRPGCNCSAEDLSRGDRFYIDNSFDTAPVSC